MARVFKIVKAEAWAAAQAKGAFSGAEIDLVDGYIHLSDATQVETTARLHFAEQHDLVLVAFEAEVLGESLKWEASRGGALFPHLYATLNPELALWVKPLPWTDEGHRFPEGWAS